MKHTIILFAMLMMAADFSHGQTQVSGQSTPVSLNIRKKKLPPILTVSDVKFTDANNNNRIDGNEECKISFTISNTGNGPALGLKMYVANLNPVKGLDFHEGSNLSTIDPGKKLNVEIPVTGTLTLASGQAKFSVSFDEPLGFPPDPFELSIETATFQAPNVRVADHLFMTENGTIRKGLPVQLKALVQNRGQGTAEEVSVSFGYPSTNVFPNGDESFLIGTLKPGESREMLFEFLPNKLYSGPTIPIEIRLSEKYGRYSQNLTASATLEAKTEKRTIQIASTAVDRVVDIVDASLSSEVDKYIPEILKRNKHRYALVFGNEDYTSYQRGLNAEANVPFAVSDASVFARYAEKTLGIPAENIALFRNAISSVMKREIEKLSKIIQYENGQAEVFIYYAGHGFPVETSREPYLMPVDISGAEVAQGISLSEFYSALTKYPAKRITVFLDACFSGGGRSAGLLAARAVRIKPKENPVIGNLVVFTASSSDQSALPFAEKQHGMFTYFLLNALQESKGAISYRQLFDKIKAGVELNAVKVNNKEQNPTVIFSNEVQNQWGNWSLN